MSQFLFKSVDDKRITTNVGQYLRYEREKRHMSVAEIAQDLRLSVDIIHKLESENFRELPQPVYIRGYIRAYCKLLNIDSQPLLDGLELPFEEQGENELPASANEDVYRLTRLWGSLVVLCIVVLLMSFWWFERAHDIRPVLPSLETGFSSDRIFPTDDTGQSGGTVSGVGSDQVAEVGIDTGSAQTATGAAAGGQNSVRSDIGAASARMSDVASGVGAGEVVGAVADAGLAQTVTGVTTEGQDSVRTDATPVAARMNNVPADVQTRSINEMAAPSTVARAENPVATDSATVTVTIMVVERRSWINIVDGKGKVLISGTFSPGYRAVLDGIFPLSFRLGDARGMRVWINDDEYDLQKNISSLNTAFFRLDGPLRP